MNFSNHIRLIESLCEGHACTKIAAKIASGDHEGFKPYWKLIADPRILSDHDALTHIATLVSDGYTSGAHPNWELKTVDSASIDDLDEEVIDVYHDHMVVPVAETHGPGKGWYEVSDENATEFVVEDKNGDVISSWSTREEAESEAYNLNSGVVQTGDIAVGTHIVPEMELVEDDEEIGQPTPQGLNRFSNKPDYIVIINAIHERGVRQQEALEELRARGLWLSSEQKSQAGL